MSTAAAAAGENRNIDVPVRPPRKLVVCMDGTGNQLGYSGATNVAKIFQMLYLGNPGLQIAYYDPGVGTMPAPTARGKIGRFSSTVGQLAFGFGMRTNLAQAYTWLMQHYQPNDSIYVFGFSRGAYTARALVAMLSSPGLLRPGSENLVDYAVREYISGHKTDTHAMSNVEEFADAFCWGTAEEPLIAQWPTGTEYPTSCHCVPVRYMGVWDTVKASGILGLGNLRWPLTHKLDNVEKIRHAVSIDEKRRPFADFLIDAREGLEEVWFAGVHSDVGGTFSDVNSKGELLPVLSTIPLKWISQGVSGDLAFRAKAYESACKVDERNAIATIHHMDWLWNLLIPHPRRRPEGAILHASVEARRKVYHDYLPGLASNQEWADPDWMND